MTNRTQLAAGEILKRHHSEHLASAASQQARVRGRHVATATDGSIPSPLFGASGDRVPIGGKCQHRASRYQGRQADVIKNIPPRLGVDAASNRRRGTTCRTSWNRRRAQDLHLLLS